MPEKNIVDCGTIKLGDENYCLVRTGEHKQEWREEGIDEPPWDRGLPNLLSAEEGTWHLGGFKSGEGIAGATEFGNTDCRWPFRMLPPPHVYTISPSLDKPPKSIWEALDYIFVTTGGYAYRIHKTTLVLTTSQDFATDVNADSKGERWDDDMGVVAIASPGLFAAWDWEIWKVTAIGTPDTWAYGTVHGNSLAVGIDRLFVVSRGGVLRNVSTGLNPVTDDNYADMVQCGLDKVSPNSMVAYGNTVLVGKPEGLFGVSADEGIGVPLLKRMLLDEDNCKGMAVIEPHVFVPHSRGLYRVIPAVSAESIGLEREVLNSTTLPRGRFRWFATDNQWVYAGLEGPSGVSSYVLVGRNARGGEPSLGPMIWDTLIDLGVNVTTRAGWISALTSQPTLFFGKGDDVCYIKLPIGGGIPGADCPFAASGVRYSPRYHFGDWNLKDFPKVQMAVKDASDTRYWSLAYRIDDGSWVTDDIDGVAMDVKSEGVKTFFFAAAAVGREIQYRWTYTGPAEDTTPAPLVYFKRFARPQSLKVPVSKAILHLAAGIKHEMAEEGRNATKQFNDLNTLSEQAASVPLVRHGDTTRVWVRHIQLLQTLQEGIAEPEYLVEATLQKREAA